MPSVLETVLGIVAGAGVLFLYLLLLRYFLLPMLLRDLEKEEDKSE